MRRLLLKEEIVSLIDSMPEEQLVWIANENERFFKDAEQILYNEFQYVLGLSSKNDLTTYIFDRIEKKDKQNRSG